MKVLHEFTGAALMGGREAKAVAISPDGKTLASGGDGVVTWDLRTGRVSRVLSDSVRPHRLVFSPEGTQLAAIELDRRAHVFTLATGAVTVLEGLKASAYVVGWHAAGVMAADGDGHLVSWPAGKVLAKDFGHVQGLAHVKGHMVVASEKGLWVQGSWQARGDFGPLAVMGEDLLVMQGSALTRRTLSGEVRWSVSCREHIDDLAVSATHIATGSREGVVHLRGLDGQVLKRIETGTAVWSVGLSGAHLAAAGRSRRLSLWTLDGKPVFEPSVHRGSVVAIAGHGDRLFTGDDAGTVAEWDLGSLRPKGAVIRFDRMVMSLDVTRAGTHFAVAAGDQARILALADMSQQAPHIGGGKALRFTPDGGLLVSDSSRIVWTIDPSSGDTLKAYGQAEAGDDMRQNLMNPSEVAFSPDGTLMGVARWDQQVAVWDLKTGKKRLELPGILRVMWSPDGRRIASTVGRFGKRRDDRKLTLFDAGTGAEVAQLAEVPTHARFLPDGRLVARLGEGVAIYEQSGAKVAEGRYPGHRPTSLEVVGQRVITGGARGEVVIWKP